MEETCCANEPCDEPRLPRAGVPEQSGSHRYEANVRSVENGFILSVGCKTFIAKTWKEAYEGLEEYWDNPMKAEKKFSRE